MATKSYSVLLATPTTLIVKWDNLQNGDIGDYFPCSQWALNSYSITGVKGAGGEVSLEFGTGVSPTDWRSGTPISAVPTTQDPSFLTNGAFRPNITNGDGSTNLKFMMTLMPYAKNI